MKKELHGTAKFLNEVYTKCGGAENYNAIQQTKGIMLLVATFVIGKCVSYGFHKIESREIKASKIIRKENQDANQMPRMRASGKR